MSNKMDSELGRMEKEISSLYSNVQKEISADFQRFTDTFKDEYNANRIKVAEGKMTQEEFSLWTQRKTVQSDLYKSTIDSITKTLVKADQAAMAVVNGRLPSVVAQSYNFVQALGFSAAQKAGISAGTFQVYNARSVQALMKGDKNVLKPNVDVAEDTRWNHDKINKAITTSIVKGDSISDVAKRLQGVTNMDNNAAVRNARTAMTSAENLGRSEAADDLKDKGIPVEEVWSATYDKRTRDTHLMLDGTVRDENGVFGADFLAHPLRYPADPEGDPEEIYNCRCRLNIQLQGIDHSNDRELYEQFMKENYSEDWENLQNNDHYQEMERQREEALERKDRLLEEQAEEAKNAQIEFVPAKTIKEAEEYAKQFADNVDYKGISLENANIINETLTELNNKYPITRLDHIQQNARGKYNACANGFGITINGKKIGERNDPMSREATQNMINFYKSMYPNGRIPRDIQSKIDHLEEKLNFSRWSVSGSYENGVRGTIIHEYGHIIADQYFGQINDEKYKTRGEGDEWKLQKLEWRDIFNKAKETKDVHKISEYGASDEHEFFAECFSAREKGEKLPDYIEKFMRRLLNG